MDPSRGPRLPMHNPSGRRNPRARLPRSLVPDSALKYKGLAVAQENGNATVSTKLRRREHPRAKNCQCHCPVLTDGHETVQGGAEQGHRWLRTGGDYGAAPAPEVFLGKQDCAGDAGRRARRSDHAHSAAQLVFRFGGAPRSRRESRTTTGDATLSAWWSAFERGPAQQISGGFSKASGAPLDPLGHASRHAAASSISRVSA